MGCGGSKEAAIDLATVARNPAAFVLILSGHHDHPACNGTYVYDGVANGKPQWAKHAPCRDKFEWTGRSWDCVYGPEATVDTPVPPLAGYNEDRGGCDIKVRYQRVGRSMGCCASTASPSPSELRRKRRELIRRELEGHEKALGHLHPLTLAKLNDLAIAIRKEDSQFKAEPLFRRLLARQDEALGPKHPDTLLTVDNLMDIVIDQEDKLDEAEVLCRRVFEAKEEALGLTHPETLEAMGILADHALARQGKFDEVEALYRRVFEAKEEALGLTHPETLQALSELASGMANPLAMQGKHDEAEALHRRVLAAKEEALGPTHPETLQAVSDLASAMAIAGKHDEAEALHRRVLAAKEEALGPTHPETLQAVSDLACHIFYPLDRAASNRERVREGLAPLLGPPGPPPLEGPSHVIQSKHIEAEALYRRAIEGDEDDREARERLARLLEIRGEAAAAEELRAQILARWGVEGVDYEE